MTSTVSDLDRCFERCRSALADADDGAARLVQARTTARIAARGGEPAFTVVLDGDRPEVRRGAHPAEVVLELDEAALGELAEGRLCLQAGILRGEIGYRGPVRKLLSISAVLRALVAADDAPAPARRESAGTDGLAPFHEQQPGDFWAIECRGVHKRLGGRDVLCGVDLGVPEGLITVVLGPSGTGKSVLLKHLIGLLRPDAGDVRVRGMSLSEISLGDLLELRRACGILFQDGALWGSMNLYDNVALPLRQHTDLTEREIALVVAEQLRSVGLADAGERMPAELSGGMRKRAGFARALVLDPQIVLFDEPDSGLDPVRTALLCDLIEEVHAELGGTYLVITHDIRAARRIADYVAVLWEGRIVQAGLADEVFESREPFVRQFLGGDTVGPLGMG